MTGLAVVAYLGRVAGLPTVADVRAGLHIAAGKIRILCIRKGQACETEPVDAGAVEWDRLLPEDYIEEVRGA